MAMSFVRLVYEVPHVVVLIEYGLEAACGVAVKGCFELIEESIVFRIRVRYESYLSLKGALALRTEVFVRFLIEAAALTSALAHIGCGNIDPVCQFFEVEEFLLKFVRCHMHIFVLYAFCSQFV